MLRSSFACNYICIKFNLIRLVMETMDRTRFYSPVAMEDVTKRNLNELAGAASTATYAIVFEGTIGSGVRNFEVEFDGKVYKASEGRAVALIAGIEERAKLASYSYKATAEGYYPIEGVVTPKNANEVVYLAWAHEPVAAPACCCCCNKE